ncbi:hypothetical protein P7C70_g4460, partial [Phenoliferia sp. Uapishka_3]
MSSVWSRPNTSESPAAPRTAFDFQSPRGQASRGFAANKSFGKYMSMTQRTIMKLSFSLLDTVIKSKKAKKDMVRKSKVLGTDEKQRRLDGIEDFYEQLETALHKSSAVTMSFMHKTLTGFEDTLQEQGKLLSELLADINGTSETDGVSSAVHAGEMNLRNLRYLAEAKARNRVSPPSSPSKTWLE